MYDAIVVGARCAGSPTAMLLAGAISDGFADGRPLAALADYEDVRNEATGPTHEPTSQLATLQSLPPEMQARFAAPRHNQEQMNRFMGAVAGTVSIPEFFSPENLGRIIGRAQRTAA